MIEVFEKISYFYEKNLWSKEQVHEMVGKNVLSKEEYKKITAEEYKEDLKKEG